MLAAAYFVACRQTDSDTPPARPDIVLVTIDTFRADRLGRGFTPAIDALAARGLRFTNARTTVPLTLPAHASLMTGQLPAMHGVRENGATLSPDAPRIAPVLKNAGYATGAFVGAFVLDRRFGLAAGFDRYDDQVRRDPRAMDRLEAERPAGQVIDAALAWLSGVRAPFFLWVHLYDPHVPYTPPDEFRRLAGGDAYNGEIAYADAQVGRLLQAVAARSRERTPVVAILGDHGEGLGEHGERTHGMLAYDSTLRIPLVLAGPGIAPGVNEAPASIVDVPPTLLRLAGGIQPGGARLDGADLLGARQVDRDVVAETMYPRAAGWHPLSVLAGERWKLIKSSELELYDLAQDPSERTEVAASHPALVQGMSAQLGKLSASVPAPAVDPAAAERLRALGYVSGGAAPADPRAPNPARVITVWTTFEAALGQLVEGSPAGAVPALQQLAAKYPSSMFMGTLGRALLESGNARAAVKTYRAAIERNARDATLFHDLAVAARAAGDPAEALRAEQAALTLNPDYPAAMNGLGLLHAEAGRTADAVKAFTQATSADPTNVSYWTNLGNALRTVEDPGGAERAYQRALDLDPGYPDALNGAGVLLVQRGAAAQAIPLFTRALQRDPELHEARLNLGIAYQESGDRVRAAETYRQLLTLTPPAGLRERQAAQQLLRQLR
jgi:tetratricopeptide (TPR) repeat protein